jgi:colicin import membrane protein
MKVFRIRAALLTTIALAAAAVVPARAEDSERAKIAQERADIEARYAERERECRTRFVVTSCVDDAKRDRRRGLDALRARQLNLDEELRHERTEARRAELATKAAEDARRDQERAARAASAPPGGRSAAKPLEPRHDAASNTDRQPGGPHDQPISPADRLGVKPTQRGTAEERQAREERSRAAYEARQRAAEEHRRAVTEKTAKRLQEHPPAAPLPLPAASSLR